MSVRSCLRFWLVALVLGGCSSVELGTPCWERVSEEVWRSPGTPASYALVQDGRALLIGAASDGIGAVEQVLLTHSHRDSCRAAAGFVAKGIPVLAPRASAPRLTPAGVTEYWEKVLPRPTPGKEPRLHDRTFNVWEYFVPAEGVEGIQCTLEAGQRFSWRGWSIEVVGTPNLQGKEPLLPPALILVTRSCSRISRAERLETPMTIERALRGIAGTFILASLALAHVHSPYWLIFTGFVGLNLLQSGFTNWCPMVWLLEKAGLPHGKDKLPGEALESR